MTKKAHRRQAGLLAPRRPRRWRATGADYGADRVVGLNPARVLLETVADLHPAHRREVPPDDPYVHPLKSGHLRELNGLIDRAMALAGAFNSDDDDPGEKALCDGAGLTLAEYESVMMRADGLDWSEIAKAQHVTAASARSSAERGIEKLRRFIAGDV